MQTVLTTLQETQILVMGTALILLVAAESAHSFFEKFHAISRERGKHLGRNLLVGALNGLVISGLFVTLWLAAAIWDRLGCTFRLREEISTLEVGLEGFDDERSYHSLWGILKTPFIYPPNRGEGSAPDSKREESASTPS